MKQASVIIDIGMTHKKVTVFDENLTIRAAVTAEFPPVMVHDSVTGIMVPAHNLQAMQEWFTARIREFAGTYPVHTIGITTHGATFVCIDETGAVCAPCVLYTYEPGNTFQDSFYRTCGSPDRLQAETFTPRFNALINLAKGIFFLQNDFPDEFSRTRTILPFPQYWGFLLTGKKVYESTYTACHTYLWDQNGHCWSSVVDKLGIRALLPGSFVPTCSILGTVRPGAAKTLGLTGTVTVTAGIHDSNASLLPYLTDRNRTQDFILNSTGTWCVCMHPEQDSTVVKEAVYTEGDIGRVVFFNRSAFDRPVKTAIFPGGMEVAEYVRLYRKISGTDDFPVSDIPCALRVLSGKRIFILPEIVSGSGHIPCAQPGIYEDGRFYPLSALEAGESVPELFRDGRLFFAVLDISLVIQTEAALYRAGLRDGTTVCTEGGFRKNRLYNELLASVLPHNTVFLTNMDEATSTGCAMSTLLAGGERTPDELGQLAAVTYEQVPRSVAADYVSYKAVWLTILKERSSEYENN